MRLGLLSANSMPVGFILHAVSGVFHLAWRNNRKSQDQSGGEQHIESNGLTNENDCQIFLTLNCGGLALS
jgi:chemotaxis signal transduction protein